MPFKSIIKIKFNHFLTLFLMTVLMLSFNSKAVADENVLAYPFTAEFARYRLAIKTLTLQKKPVTEVHIANIFKQGSDITKPLQVPEGEMGFVSGLGVYSYVIAINAISKKLNQHT